MIQYFKKVAKSLPLVESGPYRGSGFSFKIKGKVLATLWSERNEAYVKLIPQHQKELMEMNSDAFYPASKSWGKQGWTGLNLLKTNKNEIKKALLLARESFS